jgi:DNA-binding GntR family transcriptional regulator
MIGVMAVNDYLTPSLRRLLIDHTRLGQIFYRPASPAESLAVRISSDQHDAMIAAIETGDSDGVVDLTLQHWALSRDRLERFVHPDPMPLDIADLKEWQHAI